MRCILYQLVGVLSVRCIRRSVSAVYTIHQVVDVFGVRCISRSVSVVFIILTGRCAQRSLYQPVDERGVYCTKWSVCSTLAVSGGRCARGSLYQADGVQCSPDKAFSQCLNTVADGRCNQRSLSILRLWLLCI